MSIRVFANLLILIYSVSITGFGILEVGHEIAHTFKNNIHHHAEDHHHNLKDHEVLFQDDNNSSSDSNIVFSLFCSFLFYEFHFIVLTDIVTESKYYMSNDDELKTVAFRPLIPPPNVTPA